MTTKFSGVNQSTLVNTANPNRDGTGTISTILTGATTHGTLVQEVVIQALNSTSNGMIRLFIRHSGGSWALIREIMIASVIPSADIPAFSDLAIFDMVLGSTNELGVSTENAEDFMITANGKEILGFS